LFRTILTSAKASTPKSRSWLVPSCFAQLPIEGTQSKCYNAASRAARRWPVARSLHLHRLVVPSFWSRGLEPEQKCTKGHPTRVARTCPIASERRCTVLGPNANAQVSVSTHCIALPNSGKDDSSGSAPQSVGPQRQQQQTMHSQVVHRQQKQKSSPRHTGRQQLDSALASCRQVLRGTLVSVATVCHGNTMPADAIALAFRCSFVWLVFWGLRIRRRGGWA